MIQDPQHHAEGDVAIHTQLVLEALTNDSAYQGIPAEQQELLWTAALLHDVEKRSSTVVEPDGHITARGHARKGEHTVREMLYTAYRLASPPAFAEREQICKLVRYHGLPLWIFEKPDPLKTLLQTSMEVNTEWNTNKPTTKYYADDALSLKSGIENNCKARTEPNRVWSILWLTISLCECWVNRTITKTRSLCRGRQPSDSRLVMSDCSEYFQN